jgi:hypothetical protein
VEGNFYEELECVFDKSQKYRMKILLWDFNAKVGRVHIFKPTTENESLYEIRNNNEIRLVDFATFKKPIVKNTMFPRCNIHKYNWLSTDGKPHNQEKEFKYTLCLIILGSSTW